MVVTLVAHLITDTALTSSKPPLYKFLRPTGSNR